jgi:hypothetical protein
MYKKILLLLICLDGSILFAASGGIGTIQGEGESGCRVLLDKYFASIKNDKLNKKIENLINEACTGISEVDKENPFVCGVMGVREKLRGPIEAVEKCVNRYKGRWGRYI